MYFFKGKTLETHLFYLTLVQTYGLPYFKTEKVKSVATIFNLNYIVKTNSYRIKTCVSSYYNRLLQSQSTYSLFANYNVKPGGDKAENLSLD